MKHIIITEDQQMLRASADRFVRRRYPFEHREAIRKSPGGIDLSIWSEFAALGWLGLPFPEEFGGIGGTMFDVALLMETLGPALIAEPYIPTVVAGGTAILAAASEEMKGALVPAICNGELRLALAFAERESGYDYEMPATQVVRDRTSFRLNGAKSVVVGAPVAHTLIVSASAAEGLSLFLVSTKATGVTLRPYPTVDGQRGAEVTFKNVSLEPGALIGEAGAGLPALRRAVKAATVALLGEAAGLVDAALNHTAQYLNTREQFGRKLAGFQALRHRIARMYIGKEEVRALCRQAAAQFADDPGSADADEAISAAKVHVGRVGRHICEEAIQLHGAIGISDEYVAGHYLKRMVMIDHMFGNANYHFDNYLSMTRALATRAAP